MDHARTLQRLGKAIFCTGYDEPSKVGAPRFSRISIAQDHAGGLRIKFTIPREALRRLGRDDTSKLDLLWSID